MGIELLGQLKIWLKFKILVEIEKFGQNSEILVKIVKFGQNYEVWEVICGFREVICGSREVICRF